MGAVTVAPQPLSALIADQVIMAERLHADDTPVPVLAKGNAKAGRLWTVVRNDRPLPGRIRRRPCISTRPIARVSTRNRS
ncbi:IS66 family transposase [Microvirga sesbaniae]|uniref:IS66 family transposase n=1 Tax=Microvirga TaxID=186650 RepID=UPI004032E059